jgi:hypothetical protein
VFDSHFGPTRQYYYDHAIAAAAARTPQRIRSSPAVEPTAVGDAVRGLWDFGMLVLRGPLLVNPDVRFEPSTVRAAVAAATDVDHRLFCEQMSVLLAEQAQEGFNGWSYMGSARFLEDYLDSGLGATPLHAGLVDAGLEQLAGIGALGVTVTADVLSAFERARL